MRAVSAAAGRAHRARRSANNWSRMVFSRERISVTPWLPGTSFPRDCIDPFFAPEEQHVRRSPGKDAVGDDARDAVQLRLRRRRIEQREAVAIEDQVAIVGLVVL